MDRVIFLGGLGRSGTTLLERLLAQQPGVVALGEVTHLWQRGLEANEPCGCGVPFRDCAFWVQVGGRAFGGWDAFDVARHRALQRLIERTRNIPRLARGSVPAYTDVYRRLYDAAREVSGCPVVVDSSKHAALAFALRGMHGLQVIHVIRDPRAVAYSWGKDVARPENGRPMTQWGPLRTTTHWIAQNVAFDWLSRRDVQVTRLAYENLVSAPGTALASLGFPDVSCLDGTSVELSVAHTASGNPMRFATGKVELRPDDAWRSRLPIGARLSVSALAWPLMTMYGYRL